MKKTSSRILVFAVTVALLASLIVGIMPVAAAAASSTTADATNKVISGTATYTFTFDPTSALANPIAASTAVAAAGTFNVSGGTTFTFDVATNLTFTNADNVVWVSGATVAVPVVATGVLAVGAGAQVKFSVTNVITTAQLLITTTRCPPSLPLVPRTVWSLSNSPRLTLFPRLL